MTRIEWTDETWNPVVGCSKASPGCDNCYAERMACRLATMLNAPEEYMRVTNGGWFDDGVFIDHAPTRWNGRTALVESAMQKPLCWRNPRRIFVCSMGDLFHESAPFEWVDRVLAVSVMCPQHTFQILTKRPARMAAYFGGDYADRVAQLTGDWSLDVWFSGGAKNVWLGTTVENQDQADLRIPHLLKCPAAVRFVSVEPMLGPVDLTGYAINAMAGLKDYPFRGCPESHRTKIMNMLDWVICGGESGPNARPVHPDWVVDLQCQCEGACVPFFFKQWGEWLPSCYDRHLQAGQVPEDAARVHVWEKPTAGGQGGLFSWRVGRKAAGSLIDYRECKGFPRPEH